MAKITIEELFYGDKYGIMGEVVKQMFARQNEFIAAPHTFRELEIVRQTLIAVEKMKRNGDCIAEGELRDAVTVSVCGASADTLPRPAPHLRNPRLRRNLSPTRGRYARVERDASP